MADDTTTSGPGESERPAATPVAERPARRLAVSTAIFSFATGISRVLGLFREVVAKNYFGVNGPVNAFNIAFLVPNTIRALVADAALSSAFVPVFSDLLEKGERKRAWRVASSLFWLTLLGLGGLSALFILLAPWLMPPLYPDYHPLLIGLSQVLFPIVALLGASGIVVGILNSYDEFSIPALTPVAWNLVIIAGLVFGVPRVDGTDHKLYVYAGSILLGNDRAVPAAAPLAARSGRSPADGDRLARSRRQAGVQDDAARYARARADQHQCARRRCDRRLADQQERAVDDRCGVPHLHAAAGSVLRRGRNRALPVAGTPRGAARSERLSPYELASGSGRSRSCSCRPALSPRSWPSR